MTNAHEEHGRHGMVSDGSRDPLGDRFRDARERQGTRIDAAAQTLRIPVRTLDALERGAYGDLPADVYVRGFVKAYADYLGVDSDEALRDFATERRALPPAAAQRHTVTVLRPPRKRRPLTLRPRTTAIAGSVLLGIGALIYLFIEARGFTRAPDLAVTEPAGNVEITANTLVIRGTADPTAEVRINGERTFVTQEGTFEETLGVGDGVNTIRVSAVSVGGKERMITREILVRLAGPSSLSVPPTGSPLPSAAPSVNTAFRLAVEAAGEPVWVSIATDGTTAFTGILLPGSRQEVTGRSIRITSGKAAGTKVFLEGSAHGVLGDTPGVLQDVEFTKTQCPILGQRGRLTSVILRAGERCPGGAVPSGFTPPSPSATVERPSPSP